MAEPRANSLAGKRIVITRAMPDSEVLARELSRRGAIPLIFPLISFAEPEDFGPLDKAIDEIAQFDWIILTSVRAVRAVTQRALQLYRPLMPNESQLQVACVGPVTAEAAKTASLLVKYVAETHNGVALAEELGSQLAGARVLLPRSDRANPDLPAALKKLGAHVTEVIAYRTLKSVQPSGSDFMGIADENADAILFYSPSGVQNFAELTGPAKLASLSDKLAITAVGPVTAKALREAGVTRPLVAVDTSAAAVIEALERHFAGIEKAAPAGAESR